MTTSPQPQPSNSTNARPEKKAYQAPRVQVHGDVRALTASGTHAGLSDLAMSRNLFS